VIACRDSGEELDIIKEKISNFQNSGMATLGIILKTNEKAEELSRVLSDSFDIQLLTPESRRFSNGITVTSIQMSKGLEFDEAIIPSADRETYHTDHDRKLLYIACTRAMHKLSFLHTGRLTGLVGEERPTRFRNALCSDR
jgi:DNA helicase-2/ATP-dependent DNA helicase PcrA